MLEYAHIFLSLITAVVYLIIGLAINLSPDRILFNLIFVIAAAYVAGLALRRYLKNTVFKTEDIDLSEEVSKMLAEEDAQSEGAPADEADAAAQAPARQADADADAFDFETFDE